MEFLPFALKLSLVGESSHKAKFHLSNSYCEPLTVRELFALEKGSEEEFFNLTLGYPGYHGSPSFRVALTQFMGMEAEQVIPANGADDTLFAFMLGHLRPGDHVIVHSPAYQALYELPRSLGCTIDLWKGNPECDWQLDFETLEKLVRKNTRLVIINTPHNPTGNAMTSDLFSAVFQLAEQHGFLVVSDEIYRGLELDPSVFLPSAATHSELGISIGSMSKSFGLPGLRVGWLATRNQEVLQTMRMVQSYTNSFLSLGGEFLAAIALRNHQQIFRRNRELINSNLFLLNSFFRKHDHIFEWTPPRAGTVKFVRLRKGSAQQLAKELLDQAGVLVAPSVLFDCEDNYWRIGCGTKGVEEALLATEEFLRT